MSRLPKSETDDHGLAEEGTDGVACSAGATEVSVRRGSCQLRWLSSATGHAVVGASPHCRLGVLAFLLLHILDIFLVGYGPKTFNDLVFLYRIRSSASVRSCWLRLLLSRRRTASALSYRLLGGGIQVRATALLGVMAVFLAGFIPTPAS